MQKIILLVGDSGCGKDFILLAAQEYENIEIIKRYISRAPRLKEQNSISSIFSIPLETIKQKDYYYEGAEKGNWYAIEKKQLEDPLKRGKTPIVVCPNYENYCQMCKDFEHIAIPIPIPYFVYRGYGEQVTKKWEESLISRGSSTEEITNRKQNRDKYFRELYINHWDVYSSNVILNIYDMTTKEDIQIQLEGLAKKNDIDMGNKYEQVSTNNKRR